MPKDKDRDRDSTNHPCHLLSLPQAKRFWCRHCMTVFEDAITRWRHSRSCRYGVVNNFMRRRELEAKALQNTVALSPVEARLGQSIQMSDLADARGQMMDIQPEQETTVELQPGRNPSDAFTCFICHRQFETMEEMRHHVKYPCSSSKIITSRVPHPKNSVLTFTDTVSQPRSWQTTQRQHDSTSPAATHHLSVDGGPTEEISTQSDDQHMVQAEVEGAAVAADKPVEGITPTSIYVNDQGETVIEVENLDLNTEGGELSLAHLLTQLSQQGIVFDKTRTGQLQARHEAEEGDQAQVYGDEATYEVG